MWLVETTRCKLECFPDERAVDYTILSHRWGDEEVQFGDMQPGGDPQAKAGWSKVDRACRLAREEGHKYIWMDTLCIDKTSTAELSEAINSMYRWYETARICYVYLADCHSNDVSKGPADFRESDWFTRGWTLQELIAPKDLIFYNSDWDKLGDRGYLNDIICQITQIPADLLLGGSEPHSFSIAQRMSWAANRQTTRAEDMAYSLMGLFEVYMPMLYGEGGKHAFFRLQEEIIRHSTDQTIFAWTVLPHSGYSGLLASSPAAFTGCENTAVSRPRQTPTPLNQTNMGLHLSLLVRPCGMGIYHAALDARTPSQKQVGIFLGSPRWDISSGQHGRRNYNGQSQQAFETPREKSFWKSFAIPRDPFRGQQALTEIFGFQFADVQLYFNLDKGYAIGLDNGIEVIARPNTWFATDRTITMPHGLPAVAAGLAVPDDVDSNWAFFKFGFDQDFAPWAWIYPSGQGASSHSNIRELYRLFFRKKGKKKFQYRSTDSDYLIYDASRGGVARPTKNVDFLDRGPPPREKREEGYYYGDRRMGLKVTTEYVKLEVWHDERASPPGWKVSLTPTY